MQQMEKLHIRAIGYNTVIDMDLSSPHPMLRHLTLDGKLEKLPEWIPKLQNLVKLKLDNSGLKHDTMKLLKSMSNLLTLSLRYNAFEAKRLHFQDGWFKNLKELILIDLHQVNCILIDEGAFPSLETLELHKIPRLEMLPRGIQHLKKLKDLRTPSYMHLKNKKRYQRSECIIKD
ncbi:NB-ARC domain disease resistance protein [Trifolium medium]|uniref:NB-ARC domain disease resistance protein n=1 Tax=Trifolium medium TaxID=97028 RepID=A0A392NU52_9FABA|nr:NB-ARC domain disease resistance protein [Trifolium medium]